MPMEMGFVCLPLLDARQRLIGVERRRRRQLPFERRGPYAPRIGGRMHTVAVRTVWLAIRLARRLLADADHAVGAEGQLHFIVLALDELAEVVEVVHGRVGQLLDDVADLHAGRGSRPVGDHVDHDYAGGGGVDVHVLPGFGRQLQ